jgi:hypothetical protein
VNLACKVLIAKVTPLGDVLKYSFELHFTQDYQSTSSLQVMGESEWF